MTLEELDELTNTQYGFYTRYSNNSEFRFLERIKTSGVKQLSPEQGIGNMFIRYADNKPLFIVAEERSDGN